VLNNTGANNTGVGAGALQGNVSGSQNTALGTAALGGAGAVVGTGGNNTAVGYSAAGSIDIGENNVAVGTNALLFDVNGSRSVAVGFEAMRNQAPVAATDMNNVAVGYTAARGLTTGTQNTALGSSAGSSITTGSNLTLVGFDAQPVAATSVNQITLGNASVTSLRCAVNTITLISDQRDKAEIQDLTLGLDFLKTVHPVQFKWDRREWYEDGVSDGSKKGDAFEPGFIAQELDAAQIAASAEWMALTLKDNPERLEATPMRLFPVVVKACQELAAQAAAATARAIEAERRLDALEAALAALQNP
jgi:hypothetical protein